MTERLCRDDGSLLDVDDPAVVHVGEPLAEGEDAVIVGDDDDRPVRPDDRVPQQFHDGEARLVVEGRELKIAGKATVPYYISGATPGYRVVVRVYVSKGSRKGTCSTSFLPHS